MIRLTRPTLKDLGIIDNDGIMDELLKMSCVKCAYCEEKLYRRGKAEKEHFFAKSIHPELSDSWDNLLPACRSCNGSKGDWDCEHEPIIDPTKDSPREHLKYSYIGFEPRNRSILGLNTIECFRFYGVDFRNDRQPCFDAIREKIQYCIELLNSFEREQTEAYKRRLQATVVGLLNLVAPENEYSALYATILSDSSVYEDLRKRMIAAKPRLWNEKMRHLDKLARDISLA